VNATPWPLYPQERDVLHIIYVAGWVPGLIWMDVENLAALGFEMKEVHSQKAHCCPSKGPLISDRFEPTCQRFSTYEFKMQSFRKIPLKVATIWQKIYIALQLLTIHNKFCTIYSTCMEGSRYEFAGKSLQRNLRYS